jgi:hypothetical protein
LPFRARGFLGPGSGTETSAPAGTAKWKVAAGRLGRICRSVNCSTERWPKLSAISITDRARPLKPTRSDWMVPSLLLGVASTQLRPS